jgi:multiple sugar transport system substrate-binding protein
MQKRTLSLTLTLLLGASFALSGCGNGSASNSAAATQGSSSPSTTASTNDKTPAGVVTIRTTMPPGELSDDQIKEFESENPNIKVELVPADDTKLMAMIAAGTGPDVIRISGVQQLPTYVSRDLALNLDSYFKNSKLIKTDDLLPVANIFKYNGSWYGLPKDWSPDQALFINKKLFAAAGVPIPDDKTPLTYSALLDIATKLTKIENGKVVTEGMDGDDLFSITNVQTQLQQVGKSLWSSDMKKVNINNDDVKAILDRINKFVQAKAVFSPINPAPNWTGGTFIDGTLAIAQFGYWFSGSLRSDPKTKDHLDDYMMLPAPVVDGGTRYSPVTGGTGAIILKQSKHPDEAFKFLEWYMAGKPADDRAKSGWGVPIFKSKLSMMPQQTNFDKQTFAVLNDEIKNGNTDKVLQFDPYLNSSAVNGLIDKLITPIYFGKDTPEKALPELEKQSQALISEGMDIAGVK